MPLTDTLTLAGFNPRTHEECDGIDYNQIAATFQVSIHALTRSATPNLLPRLHQRHSFNPRTHEECDKFSSSFNGGRPSFNPRTHEECDEYGPISISHCFVSIHALTRSATYWFINNKQPFKKFQSTHSRGVRQEMIAVRLTRQVSIHALTRSATIAARINIAVTDSFNPRTHEECDPIQFRPDCLHRCFNPRTHEECDKVFRLQYRPVPVSIHALTRSATPYRRRPVVLPDVSIHALTRSATLFVP
mgnify:CR=1 FL=1